MKRYLCPQHIHHLKTEGKSIQLSTEKCSICRWQKRPLSLKDMARELENIAWNLRFVHDEPDYDPFGFTYVGPLEKILNRFYNNMHPDYREGFIKSIKGEQ